MCMLGRGALVHAREQLQAAHLLEEVVHVGMLDDSHALCQVTSKPEVLDDPRTKAVRQLISSP